MELHAMVAYHHGVHRHTRADQFPVAADLAECAHGYIGAGSRQKRRAEPAATVPPAVVTDTVQVSDRPNGSETMVCVAVTS
jgi:hypothetical protein